MTTPARSSSGGAQAAPTTPLLAGRFAAGSHDAAATLGSRRCRMPYRCEPCPVGCADGPTAHGSAGRHPGPPGTWWCRPRWRRSPPRSAAAHHRRRPGGACSQACYDRPDLRLPGPPRLARALMVSTLARDQPSRPCSPSRSKTTSWSWSNTLAWAHSVKRRQQVAGEPQPSSRAGSSRRGGWVLQLVNDLRPCGDPSVPARRRTRCPPDPA